MQKRAILLFPLFVLISRIENRSSANGMRFGGGALLEERAKKSVLLRDGGGGKRTLQLQPIAFRVKRSEPLWNCGFPLSVSTF